MSTSTTLLLPPSGLQSPGLLLQWILMRCGLRLYSSRMPRIASTALEVSSHPHSEPLYSPLRIPLPQSPNIHDMARQLQESEERQKAMGDELSRRPELHDADVEALKQKMREELRLMQEARRQMGVTDDHMRAGASSVAGGGSSSATAAQDPPLPPPAP
ncbi:hypothetical protein PIB30_057655 [Stylosanthes scabra]|uniref:Uncharacterized protein n=1 Tax=Stylosanthes scabra TaxID=79078 RepID=A0ABU6YJZ3_9FABA|nr:hypothetical protein [Stylosanthes scabra]